MTESAATLYSTRQPSRQRLKQWASPLTVDGYDRRPDLTGAERRTFSELAPAVLQNRSSAGRSWPPAGLERLVTPLMDAVARQHMSRGGNRRRQASDAAALILLRCASLGRSFWGWDGKEWADLLAGNAADFRASLPPRFDTHCRAITIGLAYQLGQFTDFHLIGKFNRKDLAERIFGSDAPALAEHQLVTQLISWGYQADPGQRGRRMLSTALWQVLLVNQSPLVEDLTTEAFVQLRLHPATLPRETGSLFAIQRAAAAMGHYDAPRRAGMSDLDPITGTSPEWANWVDRWHRTSTLTPRVRTETRVILAKIGRWLAPGAPGDHQPERMEQADLRGMGRRGGPDDHRRLHPTQRLLHA